MVPLAERTLPEALAVLRELATDLYWSWNHCGDKLWEHINPEVWAHTQNPVSVLQLTSNEQLQHLADDKSFVEKLQQLAQARHDYLTKPAWYGRHYPNQLLRGIAYFSMEFGLCEALPLYAGGLGMLAGDYLKTASDLGVPLVGIGLLYQQGYFRQTLDSNGWQQETYLYNDPTSLPIKPLLAADGSWLHIDTQFLSRRVRFRVWRAQVGRVTLYLLDSNDACNQPSDRGITSSLYGGGSELRLVQEMALGICGWRLIETLGLDIDICHLNEGHAAFATLERIRSYCEKHKVSFWEALWGTRIGNIFTTHTPVAAGFDRYTPELLRHYLGEYCLRLGVPIETLIGLGRANPQDEQEPFNMAYLAMRTCAKSNAVSQLHGKVSRHIFQPLFPRWPEREVPVDHVTNGVHVPTWDSPWADHEWTQLFGKERWRGDLDSQSPADLTQLSDTQLSHMATHSRAALVDYVRKRLITQWRQESLPLYQEHDLRLDPNILTLGFARRFAEYKRSDLLLHDPERLARILCNSRYPVQLLVAGKAHPADNLGKQALQHWHKFVHRPDVRQHVVFIEDYDIALAQQLVQGVDLWINTPRRPWEACGTSGMKVLVNGGLNLSTLDGWWAEAYTPDVGWALSIHKEGDGNHEGIGEQDACESDTQDAEQLYQLLENEVIPLFYKHNNKGLPEGWLARMRSSMTQLTTRFSSNRMIKDYIDHFYLPAATGFSAREHDGCALAKHLHQWQQQLQQHWYEIHLGATEIKANSRAEVTVYLGDIQPDTIAVEAIADATHQQPAVTIAMALLRPVDNALNAYRYSCQLPNDRAPEDFTVRVISAHVNANIPVENTLIYWQTRY